MVIFILWKSCNAIWRSEIGQFSLQHLQPLASIYVLKMSFPNHVGLQKMDEEGVLKQTAKKASVPEFL